MNTCYFWCSLSAYIVRKNEVDSDRRCVDYEVEDVIKKTVRLMTAGKVG